DPVGRERDRRVAAALLPVRFDLLEGETLAPPEALRNGDGRPFVVESAFARAFHARIDVPPPLPAPGRLPPLPADVAAAARPLEVPIPSPEELGLAPEPLVIRGGERAGQ